jgi:hypothetical protein
MSVFSGNTHQVGRNGWFVIRVVRLVFNFHLQTRAISASTPTQPWVKTLRRKVAYPQPIMGISHNSIFYFQPIGLPRVC